MEINIKLKHLLLVILIQIILIGGVFGVGYWKGWQKASSASSERIAELEEQYRTVRTELSEAIEINRRNEEERARILDDIGYEAQNGLESLSGLRESVSKLEVVILALGRIFEYVEEEKQNTSD